MRSNWVSGKLTCLAVGAALLAAAPAAATLPPPEAARAAWGFDRTDLAPHPGVLFGLLPNGMRYAIMRNAVPAGGLSVRLRFDAGAKMEGRQEQGYLHLIEHLIFHGTPNIPAGSLPLMLAHRGMRHFTDISAFTSFDETVYRLDMAKADAAARNAALLVMHEIATNLVFTPSAIRGAKRDVREEIGARDEAADRILAAQNAFFVPGTAIDRGPVAGTRSMVARARPEALRRLYENYYVPRRATLIFVGDFDPRAVEAELTARFSAWSGQGVDAPDPPSPVIRVDRGLETRLFVHPEAPTVVTIAAVAPLGAGDAGGARDSYFLQTLAARMLNRRLARLAAGSGAPFASADLAVYDHYSTAHLARIEIEAANRDWRAALQAGAVQLRTALKDGFSQSELDEQIAASRSALLREAATPTTPALADAIADATNRNIVFTEPADSSGTDAYLKRVRLVDVNTAFRSIWPKRGPLIFVSHNRRIPNADAAIAALWGEATP